jgi:hypothetical protein
MKQMARRMARLAVKIFLGLAIGFALIGPLRPTPTLLRSRQVRSCDNLPFEAPLKTAVRV